MATTYLSRTFTASATGEEQFTLSMWVKRSGISATQYLFNAYSDTNNYTGLYFDSTDKLVFSNSVGGSSTGNLTTNRLFRDTSGFYNIVAVWDSNNGTPGDRMKLYVNGVEETSFATDTNPSSGDDSFVGDSGKNCLLGYKGETGFYFNGLMTHVQLVDSAALAPTEFGEVDATSGIWKIKTACYATPGTNGFCLKMETTSGSGMGTDSSGEGNNLTASGTPTQTVDNPSNVFCTINPLNRGDLSNNATLSNGNTYYSSDTSGYNIRYGTLGASKGKWYWEGKFISHTPTTSAGMPQTISGALMPQGVVDSSAINYTYTYGYSGSDGVVQFNSTSSNYGTTILDTVGQIGMVAMDLDNNKLYFGVNGVWTNSANPSAGTGAYTIADVTTTPEGFYYPSISDRSSNRSYVYAWNFGNGYFGTTAVSSAGTSSTDDDSIWEYDCPTAFYGLNTKNLNTYG